MESAKTFSNHVTHFMQLVYFSASCINSNKFTRFKGFRRNEQIVVYLQIIGLYENVCYALILL